MAVPKKKMTRRRKNNRRSQGHGKVSEVFLARCSNCNAKVFPHSACEVCGFYKGRKVFAKLV